MKIALEVIVNEEEWFASHGSEGGASAHAIKGSLADAVMAWVGDASSRVSIALPEEDEPEPSDVEEVAAVELLGRLEALERFVVTACGYTPIG